MKVLYISGYTDSFIAERRVLEEGIHLLHKPFTQEALAIKVRELLDAGQAATQTVDVTVTVDPVVTAPGATRSR